MRWFCLSPWTVSSCPWKCFDIWLSQLVWLFSGQGMKKADPCLHLSPFLSQVPRHQHFMSISAVCPGAWRQAGHHLTLRSLPPRRRKSQHPDDNARGFSVREVVGEEHGQTIHTSVTHSPWRGHLRPWNPFPWQQARRCASGPNCISIFANQVQFLLFSHIRTGAAGQGPHRDFRD